jgi:hypothetical protein
MYFNLPTFNMDRKVGKIFSGKSIMHQRCNIKNDRLKGSALFFTSKYVLAGALLVNWFS